MTFNPDTEPELSEHDRYVYWRDEYEEETEAERRWRLEREQADAKRQLADLARVDKYACHVTRWPDARLQAEMDRLRELYFPNLTGVWTVHHLVIPTQGNGDSILGQCDGAGHRILIDLCRRIYRSDRQVRATLLHELCHAATDPGHGLSFFREVERLFEQGAPMHVYFGIYAGEPDMPLVLVQLPECRRRYERQERRRWMWQWRRASERQRRFPFLPQFGEPRFGKCERPTFYGENTGQIIPRPLVGSRATTGHGLALEGSQQ